MRPRTKHASQIDTSFSIANKISHAILEKIQAGYRLLYHCMNQTLCNSILKKILTTALEIGNLYLKCHNKLYTYKSIRIF